MKCPICEKGKLVRKKKDYKYKDWYFGKDPRLLLLDMLNPRRYRQNTDPSPIPEGPDDFHQWLPGEQGHQNSIRLWASWHWEEPKYLHQAKAGDSHLYPLW